MPKTNAAIADYLALLFTNVAWPNIGDVTGLLPSGTSGNFYVSIHTAYPGVTGNQTTSEAAYTGYGRVAIARVAGNWTIATPQVSNTNAVIFPACTSGGPEVEMYWGLGTALTGTGNLLYTGPLSDKIVGFTAETSDDITIPNLTLVVDNRIAFFSGTPDDTFPTGLTQGTVYFVKSVAGDVITVSTTSGGATVDITAVGSGVCAQVSPFSVSSGIIPTIASGDMVILEN